ncbi:hypothetical protein GE21DRAFT_1109286 [Neurospora crassa]|nr:hypothetical protein GE21DRAFT_1109286 [Neurospora crassa]
MAAQSYLHPYTTYSSFLPSLLEWCTITGHMGLECLFFMIRVISFKATPPPPPSSSSARFLRYVGTRDMESTISRYLGLCSPLPTSTLRTTCSISAPGVGIWIPLALTTSSLFGRICDVPFIDDKTHRHDAGFSRILAHLQLMVLVILATRSGDQRPDTDGRQVDDSAFGKGNYQNGQVC